MVWKQKKMEPLVVISRTSFLVSLLSYLLFWLADIIQPGFVSRYFSVHIFLFAAILSGSLWVWVMEDYVERRGVHILIALTFGLVLAMLTWGLIEDLGIYRLFLGLLLFLSPSLVYLFIKS